MVYLLMKNKPPLDLYIDTLELSVKYDGVLWVEDGKGQWHIDAAKAKKIGEWLVNASEYLEKDKNG